MNAEKYITTYSTTYNKKGLAQSKLWPEGTICLTIAANIGEVAILGMDACFPDSVVGISSDSESNEYIYYFLTTLQRHLDSKATMAAQKNINLRVLSDIEIPLPNLKEQKSIVAHLDALSEHTRALEAATQEKLNHLTALKASLLDAAFKGQL
jgi:type I restriction enzyme S subunit